ncbi:MAG: hypothetical protein K2O88_04775, partial [Paramuribaculum sp.]|nr:hypothetical protein [Paramuribaculum sp.]
MDFSELHLPDKYSSDKKFVAEWTKMLKGEVYEASYEPFLEMLMRTRKLIKVYNKLEPDNTVRMQSILRSLLRKCGENIIVNQPFRCDYGCNISIGENFMANFNLTILDEALVTIGDNVFMGPNVSIYTAWHPVAPQDRTKWGEGAEPVP